MFQKEKCFNTPQLSTTVPSMICPYGIYPTELELKKENNSNSCTYFLDLYIYTENGEFHTRLFDTRDNFGFDIVRMLFYCSNTPSKRFYGSKVSLNYQSNQQN